MIKTLTTAGALALDVLKREGVQKAMAGCRVGIQVVAWTAACVRLPFCFGCISESTGLAASAVVGVLAVTAGLARALFARQARPGPPSRESTAPDG